MHRFALMIASLTLVGAGCASAPEPGPVVPPGVACTMEAKLCPDGSYVGRMPPSCEFAPCPIAPPAATTTAPTPPLNGTSTEPVFCTLDAKLCPNGSYVGRVAPDCEFAPCPTP